MWQVAVLTRIETLQAFLSSNECENVKSTLFEQRGVSRVNAETSQEATAATSHETDVIVAAGGGDSVHLERWKKWKLEGAKIDKLTSTVGTEADAALEILETRVTNLRFFARGKRGILFAGKLRSNDQPVVAKLSADAIFVGSVTLEARWLRVMNRMGIGAQLIDAGSGWFLCERLEGKNVVEFLGQNNKVVTPANALWVVREMLCQCFAMDLMGVNKDEMTHPHRHIIVHRSTHLPGRWQCTFIDFEKCSCSSKPRNVTQLCQFLTSPRMVALLAKKHVNVDIGKLRQCTKRYKQTGSTHTFSDIMRVFGLYANPMTTRNTRYWRRFLSTLRTSECPYDGVCFFTLSGRMEYRDGCFCASSSFHALDVDPRQFVTTFLNHLTRQAMQEAEQPLALTTPALRLGPNVFHVVGATFSSICAVTRGKTHGLVVEKLPFGVLVVTFAAPGRLEVVFRRLEEACGALRQ